MHVDMTLREKILSKIEEQRERGGEGESEIVCVRESVCMCVCVRERVIESLKHHPFAMRKLYNFHLLLQF